MDIPPQAVLLYKGKWTADCDNILLDSLLSRQYDPQYTNPLFPTWSLVRTAASEIASIGGVKFTTIEVDVRVDVLHSRYKAFKEVVMFPGARWDYPSKSVIASDEVWLQIFENNDLARAYYHHEEPMFSKLECLFGKDDVKPEPSNEVIVISADTEKLPSELHMGNVGTIDEEVNSPATFPRTYVRRKLFDEDLPTRDMESGTTMQTRAENAATFRKPPPPHLRVPAGQFCVSPLGSSCCSNSLNGLLPHQHK